MFDDDAAVLDCCISDGGELARLELLKCGQPEPFQENRTGFVRLTIDKQRKKKYNVLKGVRRRQPWLFQSDLARKNAS